MAQYERQTAFMTNIHTLLGSGFVKGEAQMQPSYIVTKTGQKMGRVHLIAVIVATDNGAEATFDDGTGKLVARSFDTPDFFSGVALGDIVRVIGKVRSFNEQLYLIPEIVKKIADKKWVAYHKLCIENTTPVQKEEIAVAAPTPEVTVEEVAPSGDTITEKILACIKETDSGDGAQIEVVIEQVGQGSEKIIQSLLETGGIFEIRPGRVKILE